MQARRIGAKPEETTLPFGIDGLCWKEAAPGELLGALPEGKGTLSLLKDSPLRKVFRWVGPEGSRLILKTFTRKGRFEALRSAWIRSRALLELARLKAARLRGLPVPRVLGAAVEKRILPRFGLLVLEDLGEGRDLLDLLRKGEAEPALMARAGKLLARAFAAGLRPRDLHLGNLYLGGDGNLHLLDLHAEVLGRSPWRPRARALTALYLSLPWPEQSQLRAALFTPLGLPQDPPFLPAARSRALKKRIARAFRDSGSYRRCLHGIRRHPCPQLPSPLPSLEDLLAQGQPLKQGRRGKVLKTPFGILKTRSPRLVHRLWAAQEALTLLDLPHPKGLLLYTSPPQAALLSQALPPKGDTHSWPPPSELARDLGASYARLHACGFRFRDGKGDNFRLAGDRLAFVDLDGFAPLPPLRKNAAIAGDLARLLAWLLHQEGTPFLRGQPKAPPARAFLRAYLMGRRAHGHPVQDPRSLLQAVSLGCAAWRRKHPQNRKP